MIFRVKSKRRKAWVWSINLTCDSQRIRQSGFATRDEAEEAVAAIRLRQRSRRLGLEVAEAEITLGQLLAAREKDKAASDSTMRARMLGWFTDFVKHVGADLPVRSLTVSHLREYRGSQTGGPGTVNNKLTGVITALNAAHLYFRELEGYRAPSLPHLKTIGRSVLVPRKEFQALLTALRTSPAIERYPEIPAIIELLALTGARIGEVLSIKPSQIDHDRELLTIIATKTRTSKPTRLIPITPRMALILRHWRTPTITYPALHKIFTTTRNSIEASPFHIHSIRHTAASIMAEAGVSHGIIAEMLGHVLSGMTVRYVHATIPALRQAALVLERWCTDSASSNLRVV